MNYTESNDYANEAWIVESLETFVQGVNEETQECQQVDYEKEESFKENHEISTIEEGKLEFDGILQVFQGQLGYLSVLYINLPKETSEILIDFYKMNSHKSLLPFIGIQHNITSDYFIFQHKPLKSLLSYLNQASFDQKFRLVQEMTQIFAYFASKDFNFSPNLGAFCLTKKDHLVLYNPISEEEFFTAAPETLAFGIVSRKTSSWALGMNLYEILTAKHPFSRESLSVLRENWKTMTDEEVVKKKEDYFILTTQETFNIKNLEDILNKNSEKHEKIIIGIRDLLRPLAKSRISIEDFLEKLEAN